MLEKMKLFISYFFTPQTAGFSLDFQIISPIILRMSLGKTARQANTKQNTAD